MAPQTRYRRAREGHVLAGTTLGDGPRDLLNVTPSIFAFEHHELREVPDAWRLRAVAPA